jgi:hypothetical protein
MQCWTRRDPPKPPSAPPGLCIARQGARHVKHHCLTCVLSNNTCGLQSRKLPLEMSRSSWKGLAEFRPAAHQGLVGAGKCIMSGFLIGTPRVWHVGTSITDHQEEEGLQSVLSHRVCSSGYAATDITDHQRRGVTWCAQATTLRQTPEKQKKAARSSAETGCHPKEANPKKASVRETRHVALHAEPPVPKHAR